MTDHLVIDASVIAKIFLKDEDPGAVARTIALSFASGALDLIAPEIILYEVPSAILNAVRRQRLSPTEGQNAVEEFLNLELPTVGSSDVLPNMVRRAYALAEEFGCRLPDALYLAVAMELDLSLITADARLYRGLRNRVHQLLWFEDFRINSQE